MSLNFWNVCCPNLFFKTILANLVPFHFHNNFGITMSISKRKKKLTWMFFEIEVINQFGEGHLYISVG